MNRVRFYHLSINDLSKAEGLVYCSNAFKDKKGVSIFFLNAHCFNISLKDPDYLEALYSCDLLLNDGIGVKLGAKLIGVKFKENMNGTDFIPLVLKLAAKERKSVFLLGGESGIAEIARRNLQNQIPHINIVGSVSGYFNRCDEKKILTMISNVDVLVVGLGVPLQEKWIHANRDDLRNVGVILAGGAILDFCAGKFARAPQLVRKIHMEWLYRFLNEPKRLFKRYIFGNAIFLSHVFFVSLRKRFNSKSF